MTRLGPQQKISKNANSRLREANVQLQEVNIRKSDFIADASHELRTPLTSIKGAMDYISARLSSAISGKNDQTSLEDLHVFFEVIKKNSERLIRMVNDMLDLERIETGSAELKLTDSDLSTIAAETVTYLQIEAERKHIEVTTSLGGFLGICADEDRIRQVFMNLLSNAIKFSPENAEIVVRTFSDETFAVAEICDHGPGIPEEKKEMVFEKFYKSGSKEGAGLGLAICKSIIEAHGGIIGFKSDGTSGCCFHFKLPDRK